MKVLEKIESIAVCIFWGIVGIAIIGALLSVWKEILIIAVVFFAIVYGLVYVPIWLEKFLNLGKKTKRIALACALGAVLVFTGVKIASPGKTMASTSYTVYITSTGHKYHRAGCRYLRYSSYAVDLEKAMKNYSACSVCRP